MESCDCVKFDTKIAKLRQIQVRDVDIDHGRIGTDHFFNKMLVELPTFPGFQINQFQSHDKPPANVPWSSDWCVPCESRSPVILPAHR